MYGDAEISTRSVPRQRERILRVKYTEQVMSEPLDTANENDSMKNTFEGLNFMTTACTCMHEAMPFTRRLPIGVWYQQLEFGLKCLQSETYVVRPCMNQDT